MEEITIIIKTFIRIKCVERLLNSIKKSFSKCPIIICDDSENAKVNKENILKKFSDLRINYIVAEENIGLSKGRNILVQNVKTKYFLLCDDDFVFYKKTNILLAKKILEDRNYDILGGLCLHAYRINFGSRTEKFELFMRKLQKKFNSYRKVGYRGDINLKDKEVIININKIKYNSKEIYDTDICENFFLARTDVVKKVLWCDKLKLNEHEDFFIRAKKANLKIGVTPVFKVYHYPETDINFKKHRKVDYYKEVLLNNNLEKLKIYRNNVGVIQTYIYKNNEYKKEQEYTKNILGKIKSFYYKYK